MYVMRKFQKKKYKAFSNFPVNVCITRRHFLCVKFKTSINKTNLKHNIKKKYKKCEKHISFKMLSNAHNTQNRTESQKCYKYIGMPQKIMKFQ